MLNLKTKKVRALILLVLLLGGRIVCASEISTLNVAYFTHDVPGIDPLSPTMDPDSYSVIPQIFDTLVYLDLEGNFQPQLATRWRQLSETAWEFTLRKNVSFHNGEPFDGHAVKFTYEYALDPGNRTGNAWILNTISRIDVDEDDPFRVVIHTSIPDGMFLNRINLFGSVCPPNYIKKHGIQHFFKHPVGTGPYVYHQWQKGEYIELRKNERYWNANMPNIDVIKFHMLPEETWLENFANGTLDFIPNLAGNQTSELMRRALGQANIIKRLVLSGYWTLVRNSGALADRRVRQALNYAINKEHVVKYGDQGNAIPLASLGKVGEFGHNPELEPYVYDPGRARALLQEAGVSDGLHLKALAADIAAPVAQIIRKNLADVGVSLELEIVARSEWAKRVVAYKIRTGKTADYDLAINLVDNPTYNLAFHAGLFLFSSSPWSLLNSSEFDERYLSALHTADVASHERLLKDLDRYIHEEALMLFTTQRVLTAAVRSSFHIPKYALNGHLDYEVLTTATLKARAEHE